MVILNASVIALLTVLLSVITLIHVYWMFGGERGLDAALPHDISRIKQSLAKPVIVALNFMLVLPVVMVLSVLILSLYPVFLPAIVPPASMIYKGAAAVLIVRGLGGRLLNKFSKKAQFIHLNNQLYSPVALLLGVLFASLLFV
eukprot:COSAG01_NODE_1_length_100484_cov_170.446142_36_plen_144_part_00